MTDDDLAEVIQLPTAEERARRKHPTAVDDIDWANHRINRPDLPDHESDELA